MEAHDGSPSPTRPHHTDAPARPIRYRGPGASPRSAHVRVRQGAQLLHSEDERTILRGIHVLAQATSQYARVYEVAELAECEQHFGKELGLGKGMSRVRTKVQQLEKAPVQRVEFQAEELAVLYLPSNGRDGLAIGTYVSLRQNGSNL